MYLQLQSSVKEQGDDDEGWTRQSGFEDFPKPAKLRQRHRTKNQAGRSAFLPNSINQNMRWQLASQILAHGHVGVGKQEAEYIVLIGDRSQILIKGWVDTLAGTG